MQVNGVPLVSWGVGRFVLQENVVVRRRCYVAEVPCTIWEAWLSGEAIVHLMVIPIEMRMDVVLLTSQ